MPADKIVTQVSAALKYVDAEGEDCLRAYATCQVELMMESVFLEDMSTKELVALAAILVPVFARARPSGPDPKRRLSIAS